MGADTTGDMAFYKPTSGETGWGAAKNSDFDDEDAELSRLRRGILKTEITFSDGDTTPDVSAGACFVASHTAPCSTTAFDGATQRQRFTVRATNGNLTLVHGTTIVLPAATNITMLTGQVADFYFNGTAAVLMGGAVTTDHRVSKPGTATAPWKNPTDQPPFGATTTKTIDLSKDSPPADAVGAILEWDIGASSGPGTFWAYPTGGSAIASSVCGYCQGNDFNSFTIFAWFNGDQKVILSGNVQLGTSGLKLMGWLT